jgi:putative Mg2+ transporter-C (MgtC) family protein
MRLPAAARGRAPGPGFLSSSVRQTADESVDRGNAAACRRRLPMVEYPAWIGDIHKLVGPQWAGLICTVAAVLCGGIIGVERERAQKPAGTRTLILICLGSAIFAQASILMAGSGDDRTRIAAQVVSGIGFLGAGAIIREGGLVIGVTTGAAVWATAAVGLVVGSGYVAAGVVFSLIIVGTLAAARFIDLLVWGPCVHRKLEILYDPCHGRTRLKIQGILDEHQHEGLTSFEEEAPEGAPAASGRASIMFCDSHRHHRAFLEGLTTLNEIRAIRLH